MRQALCDYIRQGALLTPGDRVVCAVSGGADSMALLWGLWSLRQELGIRVEAAHFNHGLRGVEADGDEAFVRAFCREHGIPLTVDRGDARALARQSGQSIELAARSLRYAFLLRTAGEDKLATAHTADDNLETVLIHLVRGTSLRGLGGIPVRRGRIVRPLLFATRSQIEAFLRQEHIDHREDSTNRQDFCLRNRLRHHVLPFLRRENPALARRTLELSAVLREEDAYLSQLAAQALEQARCPEGGYDCVRLRSLPPVLQRRCLFALLQRAGVAEPRQSHLRAVQALLQAERPSAGINLPGGVVLRRVYDRLELGAPDCAEFAPQTLSVPGETAIPELGLKFCCKFVKNFSKTENSPTTFFLSCAMIQYAQLTVRPRRAGDRISLPGGGRSVKRLMIDRRIPAARRGCVPILAGPAGVIAVAGIGADPTYLAQAGEPALQVEIIKEENCHEP